MTKIGDIITNPVTGLDTTVVELLNGSVLTDTNDAIFVYTTVGDVLTDPADPTRTVTVTSVNVNANTGLVDQVTLDNGNTVAVSRDVSAELNAIPPGVIGNTGDTGGVLVVNIPSGNTNVFSRKLRGGRGSDGRDGYGIEICDPTGMFGCTTIGKSPKNGRGGGAGPTINQTLSPDSNKTNNGNITAISNGLSGVTVSSVGGNGGRGGDAYGNFSGKPGGNAGRGGQVTLTSNVDISTRGRQSHGIFAQSRSGVGGKGGSGFILGGGGSGGSASAGGSVSVTNNGVIATFGDGGIGLFGQSVGGSAGGGGDSWGIVGSGGSSRAGGNGGRVTLTNNGGIVTEGLAGHGILAQSIGGTGGNGGDAGGVVAFGGGGSVGGNGGQIVVTNGANATILTKGDRSQGVLAQSIGGGGGNGGISGGVVAFGGTGRAGGSGSTVTVTNLSGSVITTKGNGSNGVLAQSIGGGGGNGATSGAVVALGGNGGAAGNGSSVTVNSNAAIQTSGSDARGVFAQSIGGGGGNASSSDGVVSLGGRGSSGGSAGGVRITNGGQIQSNGTGSDAIFAQSIGGGGGSGAASGGVVSIGGSGGSGGSGSTVTINNSGLLNTFGARARGIFAQSVGGGGGTGGDSGGLVSIGGSGRRASNGGAVSVTNSGAITTGGARSNVIQAQSIGGGGGDGGTTGGVFFTLGGGGGGGGTSGAVSVASDRNLSSSGNDSQGIFAQSIGGGGGNGGNAASGSLFAGVAIGGKGGNGGNGGTVNVTTNEYSAVISGTPLRLSPLIQTLGDRSNGIFAQSVGGGGGTGGFAVQGTIGTFATVSVAVGGKGGKGGMGNTVSVDSTATILTGGLDSDGIVAQSIGGGGGNGGFSIAGALQLNPVGGGSVSVSVGGSGGGGGGAGAVNSIFKGNLRTRGNQSEGMIAQSVGGGGGNGGFNVAGSVSISGVGSGAVSVGVGGSGGNGGNGATVTASSDGNIRTEGNDASALLFQSVGGGGGNGGFSVSAALSGAGVGSGAVSAGVGGSGGGAGTGGQVNGTVKGAVTTLGSRSGGILMQSVGGGGGNGGFDISAVGSGAGVGSGSAGAGVGGRSGGGGNGSAVTATVDASVTTSGVDSGGMLIQSVGGGGGNGGFDITGSISAAGVGSGGAAVGVGGSGGSGGNASTVNTTYTGSVTTAGDDANAFLAQSIGGGGGNGGFTVAGSISGAGTGSGAVAVGVGGSGGGGGNSAAVDATASGNLSASGSHSSAVVVQSVGGGGGNGGLTIAGSISGAGAGSGAVAVGIGGFGGSGGDAGTVSSSLNGDVLTSGRQSTAFLAQSVGGGGGNGGLNVSGTISLASSGSGSVGVGIGGFGGGGGNAAAVTASTTGRIETRGKESDALLVQSQAGGGGNGALNISGALNVTLAGGGAAVAVGIGGFGGAGGNAGDASLVQTGTVLTSGADSGAVTTQSIGGGGGNGGINISGGIAGTGSGAAFGMSLGLGGFGGSGGDAGNITTTVNGSVLASGLGSDKIVTVKNPLLNFNPGAFDQRVRANGSYGVLSQSIGGGGGNGEINVASGIALGAPAASTAYGLTLGVGGFGGSGGNAGTVTVDITGQGMVSAIGDDRAGVAAQSIGGGGGNGGINVSGGIAMDGVVTLGFGGSGGNSGIGRDVNVNSDTDITSAGSRSVGLLAQSIGGGGGNGAINISGGVAPNTTGKAPSLVFGMGGAGGTGSASGNVFATQTGDISSEGSKAHGILAQSIGGGGGNGGLNVSGNITGSSLMTFVGGVGGKGAAGADAGNVTVISQGNIKADGATAIGQMSSAASGIFAQSIGGGGGNGGMNISGVFAATGSPVNIGVGGSGSGAGNAGKVVVDYGAANINGLSTLIETSGNQSAGIRAESIGGGGGNAGANIMGTVSGVLAGATPVVVQVGIGGQGGVGGLAGSTTVTSVGDIRTVGALSEGIKAKSIGGGGGEAALNLGLSFAKTGVGVNVGLGSAPGDGGNSADVSVDHSGTISTGGRDSAGIFAQSIGGGGGSASISLVNGYTPGGNISVGLGREGGTGGNAGNVKVNSNSLISTAGDNSTGILAQSVGNGGGVSGTNSFGLSKGGAKGASGTALGLSLGLKGAVGGTAGDVSVTTSGGIATSGNKAHAIYAQSTGGGGGIGGMAISPVLLSSSAGVALGGSGGVGGTSGIVRVDNGAQLSTRGEAAHGIYAQSIGGSGGSGGIAAAGGLSTGKGAAVATVGGVGGVGNGANKVFVTNTGSILTLGKKAFGVNAQSIGGGGGNGGIAINGVLSAGSAPNTTLSLAIGGVGGQGGTGKLVDVNNEGVIHTQGDEAVGIRAQSIGGGGGDGGLALNLNIAKTQGSEQLSLTLGGKGGRGGTSGNVSVLNRAGTQGGGGAILTEGKKAYGIFAQSVGGGGGNGGTVLAANFANGAGNLQVGVNIGGKGGVGGTAGSVNVTNASRIETRNNKSHGIYAQSIGGGGGNGGLSIAANAQLSTGFNPLLSLGGAGGNGNDGGTVTVNNSGSILTAGDDAHGIVAESIGGGGGDGSIGIGLASSISGTAISLFGNMAALLGGNGGDGGLGGDVTVNQSGDITVLGAGSQAIIAQSINGGGGNMVLDFGSIAGSDRSNALVLRAGADRVTNSNAGAVTVNMTGTLNMAGDGGAGHAVQAIGGGGGRMQLRLDLNDLNNGTDRSPDLSAHFGGSGGTNNAGGNINSVQNGDIAGTGRGTDGVSLQSIGGGGGRGNMDVLTATTAAGAVDIVLGGSAGSNEAGGNITHTRSGSVLSSGEAAYGMLLQTIGGGGGSENLRIASTLPVSSAPGTPTATISLGATGGTGLDGGLIDTRLNGDIRTSGNRATGLLFQSIGGGGGESRVTGVSGLSITLGGSAGAIGNGGNLSVVNNGAVVTRGAQSHGIFLQSIGGGGGAVFTDVANASVTFDANNSGNGGNIVLTQTGDVDTSGAGVFGIFAQSLGGGGGYVDNGMSASAGGDGTGGNISLDIVGNVLATGASATAVYAQSSGSKGSGDINITLAAGNTIVGGDQGAAIDLEGGANNRINNAGTIMSINETAGLALRGTSGNDRVVNAGMLMGNIDLGAGNNALTNQANAALQTGALLNLGDAANLLRNDGIIAPGGMGQALVSNLSGSYTQSADATMLAQIDFGTDTLDAVIASGSAQVDGAVEISFLTPEKVRPGEFRKTLISGAGGLVDKGLSLVTAPSVVIRYKLLFPNATGSAATARRSIAGFSPATAHGSTGGVQSAVLGYNVDFSPAGVKGNLVPFGDYIGRVQTAGSSPGLGATVTALLLAPDTATYVNDLLQLTPDFYLAQQATTLWSSQQFAQSLAGCDSRKSTFRFQGKDSCFWLGLGNTSVNFSAQNNIPGMRYDATGISAGFKTRVGNGWSVGLGSSFENHHAGGFSGQWSSRGKASQIGMITERRVQDTLFSATLAYSNTNYNTDRLIALADTRNASSHRTIDMFGGTVSVSRTFRKGYLYLKPAVSAGAYRLNGGGTNETGATALNLRLRKTGEKHNWLKTELEAGYRHTFGSGLAVRTYARVGVLRYSSNAETRVRARLEGAPGGVSPMTASMSLGKFNTVYEAGLDLVGKGGIGVQLHYQRRDDGLFGSDNLNLRLSFPL